MADTNKIEEFKSFHSKEFYSGAISWLVGFLLSHTLLLLTNVNFGLALLPPFIYLSFSVIIYTYLFRIMFKRMQLRSQKYNEWVSKRNEVPFIVNLSNLFGGENPWLSRGAWVLSFLSALLFSCFIWKCTPWLVFNLSDLISKLLS